MDKDYLLLTLEEILVDVRRREAENVSAYGAGLDAVLFVLVLVLLWPVWLTVVVLGVVGGWVDALETWWKGPPPEFTPDEARDILAHAARLTRPDRPND